MCPELAKEIREKEALLEEKHQDSNTMPKPTLKKEKAATCPAQVGEHFSKDNGGSVKEDNITGAILVFHREVSSIGAALQLIC